MTTRMTNLRSAQEADSARSESKTSAPFSALLLIGAAMFLAACGGGGGGAPAPAPPAPPPPDTVGPSFAAVPNVSPSVGTAGVDFRPTVSFTASESLASATIKLTCANSPVPGSTVVQGAVATFTPATPGLAPQDDCVASVEVARDAAGNAWSGSTAITQFKVKALDCAAPTKALTYTGGKTNALCDNVFVDENGARNGWPVTLKLVRDAEAQLATFYGSSIQGTVDFVFCGTPACTAFYTANINRPMFRPAGFFINGVQYTRAMVVNLGTGSASNLGIITHELAHGELRARINSSVFVGSPDGVPAWFDEGLATLVGADRPLDTCAGFDGVPDLRALGWGYQWVDATSNVNTAGTVYCQAQREVKTWLDRNGGRAGLLNLISRVNSGQNFYAAYGALTTQ